MTLFSLHEGKSESFLQPNFTLVTMYLLVLAVVSRSHLLYGTMVQSRSLFAI